MDTPTGTVVGTAAGLWVLGSIGGVHITLTDFLAGTALSTLGAVSFQFLKALSLREDQASKGVPVGERATVDYRTMVYAAAASPIATGLLFWLIEAAGGTANSLYGVGGFYAAGAIGPQLVPRVLNGMLGVVGKVLGLLSGAKP